MAKTPAADYVPDVVGRRFPKCGRHGIHTTRAVRAAPEGSGGWGLLCPGPPGGETHVIPVYEPRAPDRFGVCKLCGTVTTTIRPEVSDRTRCVERFTLVDCGHTIAVPWAIALGF